MKIIFMGTPEFGLVILKNLYVQENFEILAVVTQTDKPTGRTRKIEFSPVKKFALEKNLNILQPSILKDIDLINSLKEFKADLFIVAAYGKIIPESILNIPRYFCINIHGSLLPKYRGAAPVHHAIINGETVTGITIMRMDKGMDTGDIIEQVKCDILPEDTFGSLLDRLAILGSESVIRVINNINQLEFKKQDDSLATFAPIIKKESCHIDWHKTSLEILNLIRALKPRPGAYSFYGDKIIKIWSAINFPVYVNEECGKILDINNFVIKTCDGAIMITELQEQNGKRMSRDDYLRGHKLSQSVLFN